MTKTISSLISVAIIATTLSSSFVNVTTQAAFAPVDVIKLTNFRNYVQMDGTGYNFVNGNPAAIPTDDGTPVLFTGTNTDIVPAGSDKLVPAPNKDTFIDLNGNRPGFLTTNKLNYEVGDQIQLTFSYVANINPSQLTTDKKATVSVGGKTAEINGTADILPYSITINATSVTPLLFTAVSSGAFGVMVSNIRLVNLGKVTASLISGVVGSAFPSIPLTNSLFPIGTDATFTPTGSKSIKGKIVDGKFVPDTGQLIPVNVTLGSSTGTLQAADSAPIKVETNFTLPVEGSGGGTIVVGGGNVTSANTFSFSNSNTVTTTTSSVSSSTMRTQGVAGFEVTKSTDSAATNNNSAVDPSKTKILATSETKKAIDSAKGETYRTGGF